MLTFPAMCGGGEVALPFGLILTVADSVWCLGAHHHIQYVGALIDLLPEFFLV